VQCAEATVHYYFHVRLLSFTEVHFGGFCNSFVQVILV